MSDVTVHDVSLADADWIPLAADSPVCFPAVDAEGCEPTEGTEPAVSPAEAPPGDGMAGFSHMRRIGIEGLLF